MNDNFIKSCQLTKVATSQWNFTGWDGHNTFFGGQKDWNQTFITRLNEVSATIFKNCQSGANLIICHPSKECLIQDLCYFDKNVKEYDQYTRIGYLGSRYLVLSSPIIKQNEIIISRSNFEDDNWRNSGVFGIIEVLNLD